MLSTIGKTFFEVVDVDRKPGDVIPMIHLNIRNVRTGKMIGQMRFNCDRAYSDTDVRMQFNVMNKAIINPATQEGSELLEEILIGGFVWLSFDNHKLIPDHCKPYMVVHDYSENDNRLNFINTKIRAVLSEFGCSDRGNGRFVFETAYTQKLSEFLARKQRE